MTKHGESALDLCDTPGGNAMVGTNHSFIPIDEEGPCRLQVIKPFRMMQTTVTNAMFKRFIDDTGFKTEAERLGWSFVFYQQLADASQETQTTVGAEWWCKVNGACWNQVGGPGTQGQILDDHTVVHISQRETLSNCTNR